MLANFVKEKTEQKDTNNKNKTEQIKLVPNAKKKEASLLLYSKYIDSVVMFSFFTF